jgi:hypothetical protein
MTWERLDEVLSGISCALAMRPEFWPKVEGTPLSVLTTLHYPKVPPLRLFFTYDEHRVRLLWVEIIDDVHGQENHGGPETT